MAILAHARKVIALSALGVVLLGTVGWRLFGAHEPPRVRELAQVTITALDAGARTAEIAFTHPKTGRVVRLAGAVPADCEILLNGTPARLADLRVGDTAAVRGLIHQDFSGAHVEARWVSVRRPPRDGLATSIPAAGDS